MTPLPALIRFDTGCEAMNLTYVLLVGRQLSQNQNATTKHVGSISTMSCSKAIYRNTCPKANPPSFTIKYHSHAYGKERVKLPQKAVLLVLHGKLDFHVCLGHQICVNDSHYHEQRRRNCVENIHVMNSNKQPCKR